MLCSDEWKHLESTGHIQLSNVDLLMQQGPPNLYQHTHLHQQATQTVNLKITSSLPLEANDKISDHIMDKFLQQQLYLTCILVKTDEPQAHHVLRSYSRQPSQHQEFKLNQPTSAQPLSINDIGYLLRVIKAPTAGNIFKKVHTPQISSSHSDIKQWTHEQQCLQLGQPR